MNRDVPVRHVGQDLRRRLAVVLGSFCLSEAKVVQVMEFGDGNINDTYLVELNAHPTVVLQRINPAVFPDPVCIAENVGLVTAHLISRRDPAVTTERFPRVIPARDGSSCLIDRHGDVWRVVEYIEQAVSYRTVQSAEQAFEVGRMLGRFHHLLDDFDATLLCPALPGFHDLPGYGRGFCRALAGHRLRPSASLRTCCRFAEQRLAGVSLLEEARNRGDLVERLIHGDPKCDNILFDSRSGRATAIVDLDTVSQGLLQYDLGDCLRSLCNPAGERPADLREVSFDLSVCQRVLEGYCASGANLPAGEQRMLFHGVRLLTFELGLRFLTDYLEGNRYFKIVGQEDNLHRAAVQFELLARIEEQQAAIESLVAAIWS